MPYYLMTDEHMRERLSSGTAQALGSRRSDTVYCDGARWTRSGEVWVCDEDTATETPPSGTEPTESTGPDGPDGAPDPAAQPWSDQSTREQSWSQAWTEQAWSEPPSSWPTTRRPPTAPDEGAPPPGQDTSPESARVSVAYTVPAYEPHTSPPARRRHGHRPRRRRKLSLRMTRRLVLSAGGAAAAAGIGLIGLVAYDHSPEKPAPIAQGEPPVQTAVPDPPDGGSDPVLPAAPAAAATPADDASPAAPRPAPPAGGQAPTATAVPVIEVPTGGGAATPQQALAALRTAINSAARSGQLTPQGESGLLRQVQTIQTRLNGTTPAKGNGKGKGNAANANAANASVTSQVTQLQQHIQNLSRHGDISLNAARTLQTAASRLQATLA